MSLRLEGQSVVVTGASSGMGKGIVELFAKEGASVVAVARRKERLEELKASLADAPGKVEIYPGDVSLLETSEGMIDFAVEKFGKLDVLVNNAGIMDDMSPVGEATDEKFEKVMKVNLYGPMAAMRKAVNTFLAQDSAGRIVNVASEGAFKSCAGVIYCASKAALVSMTKNTAYMYRDKKIVCNAIAPGGIETEIASSMGQPNMTGYQAIAPILGVSPKPGKVSSIAQAALFLADPAVTYVNGVVLPVDGGWCAG